MLNLHRIRTRFCVSVVICCLFVWLYYATNDSFNFGFSNQSSYLFRGLRFQQKLINDEKTPLILVYTNFFSESLMPNPITYKCPYKCEFTEDFGKYNISDVVLFHSRNAVYDDRLASSPNPARLNVFFSKEASPNENIWDKKFPIDFFNVTMTFRRDSDIWLKYDELEKATTNDKMNSTLTWSNEDIDAIIANKSKLAVQFVSNCQTNSAREYLTNELTNLTTEIDIFGKCTKRECNSTCEDNILSSYYFYFAFENSVCTDYVTEKFWRLKKLIVPVVLKRSILQGIFDDSYFIAVDDYKTVEDFLAALQRFTQQPDEYKKFFGWTKLFRKTKKSINALCSLCEYSHKVANTGIQKTIPNILKWWHDPQQCQYMFAKNFFQL